LSLTLGILFGPEDTEISIWFARWRTLKQRGTSL
jgi:hypothetical protein